MASAKYRTPEYRAAYAAIRAAQRRGEWLTCVQGWDGSSGTCLMDTRDIGPDDPAHVAHDDTGEKIIGPAHERCNTTDGGKRGNQARNGVKWWPL